MPRVGTNISRNLPLSISITSTPACRPPQSVYFLTDQGKTVAKGNSRWLTDQEIKWVRLAALVKDCFKAGLTQTLNGNVNVWFL